MLVVWQDLDLIVDVSICNSAVAIYDLGPQSGSSPSKPAPIAMEYERGSVVLLYGTGKEAGRHHRREAEVQDVCGGWRLRSGISAAPKS